MEEREVELIDYLAVLWRWKWLIVAGTLGCVLAAVVATWTLPRRYHVTATIDTGDLTEERMKDVDRLVARLNAVGLVSEDQALIPQPGTVAFTAEFKRPALVELGVGSDAPAEAARALAGTATRVIDELNRLIEFQNVQLEAVRRRVEELRRNVDNLRQARTAALRKADDPVGALVFARLSVEITESERNLVDLERLLLAQPRHGQRARLLIAPEVPRVPNRPRLKLYLAVAVVAGLMGSVLLAFFIDYLQQAGRRRPASPPAGAGE